MVATAMVEIVVEGLFFVRGMPDPKSSIVAILIAQDLSHLFEIAYLEPEIAYLPLLLSAASGKAANESPKIC